MVRSTQSKFSPVTKPIKNVANKITNMSQDQMAKAAVGMASSESKAVQAMGNQISHAMQQDDTIKNALIWSLSQQPAFRKTVQKFIVDEDEAMSESLEPKTEETESRIPFERPEEEVENRVPFERPEEEVEENDGREPASLESSTVKSSSTL